MRTIDEEKIRTWLFERAETHQNRGDWAASFEDLYLVTAIFRGDFMAERSAWVGDQPPVITNPVTGHKYPVASPRIKYVGVQGYTKTDGVSVRPHLKRSPVRRE